MMGQTQAVERPANRLAKATSPYLLQHAHNPVDWYEWGDEAFAKAKNEDKPIFLSIGYAACHWCHVMEHESFENDEVAAVLNEHFVSIKVDREERPDIDELYMAYTQAATGHGGWPMSVFLTPEATPFHAGTYFPEQQFVSMLQQIGRGVDRRSETTFSKAQSGRRKFFEQWAAIRPAAEGVIPLEAVDATAMALARYFDPRHGRHERRRHQQVSAEHGHGLDAARPSPDGQERAGRSRGHDARSHGPRRHLRSHRRRHLPLQHRHGLARAALRKNALRPGHGQCHLPRRLPRAEKAGVRGSRAATSSTTSSTTCARPKAASTPAATPTAKGWKESSTSGRCRKSVSILGDRGWPALLQILRRHRPGQLVRAPWATHRPDRRTSCTFPSRPKSSRKRTASTSKNSKRSCRLCAQNARRPKQARPARPRRQDSHRLERPDDRQPRQGSRNSRRAQIRPGRGEGGGLHSHENAERRPTASHLPRR